MPAKFQLKRGTTGKFRFSLLSTNGQIVASSEVYERKAAALAGIRSVQKLAGTAQVEDTTTKEWADAEAAKKAAKKAATKKAATKKAAVKVAAPKKAAVKVAAPKKAAPKKAAPKKAAAVKAAAPKKAAATGRRPVRQTPQPFSTPPEDLTPRI